MKEQEDIEAAHHFENQVNVICATFKNRTDDIRIILHAGRGLFQASKSVERDEWKQFSNSIILNNAQPGILGLGFARWVNAEAIPELETLVQNDGLVNFKVWPQSNHSQQTPIIYLEPQNELNEKALGYDMFSETRRQVAMQQAYANDQEVMTRSVKLVQDANSSAILVYYPVYVNNTIHETLEDRKLHLFGFVYMPIRVKEFIERNMAKLLDNIQLEVFEDKDLNQQNLIYDNQKYLNTNEQSKFVTQKPFEIFGQTWVLRFSGLKPSVYTWRPYVGLGICILLTFFIFIVFYNSTQLNEKAEKMAHQMTMTLEKKNQELLNINNEVEASRIELKASEARFRAVIDNALDIIILMDEDGRITEWNKQAQQILGRTLEEVKGKNFVSHLLPIQKQQGLSLPAIVNQRVRQTLEMVHHDGHKIMMEASFSEFKVNERRSYSCFCRDITELAKQQELDRQRAATLERMNRLMVDRELRMSELKKQLQILQNQQKGSA